MDRLKIQLLSCLLHLLAFGFCVALVLKYCGLRNSDPSQESRDGTRTILLYVHRSEVAYQGR